MDTIDLFKNQTRNIEHMLRAADVYTLHLIALMRKEPVDNSLIEKIIIDNGKSALNYSWRFFLSEAEYDALISDGRTRKVCEEIVLSVYTALEQYLILKFKEYLKHHLASQPDNIYCAVEKRISYRSLRQIKDNFREYLDIHLPSFEPKLTGFSDSWFLPKSSWQGITMLSEARNEIAHEGTATSHEIVYLIDAYAPLHFTTRWVALFNANFDSMIYEGRKYALVRDHDKLYAST